MLTFEHALGEVAKTVNVMMNHVLPVASGPEKKVMEAMKYGVMNGGKGFVRF